MSRHCRHFLEYVLINFWEERQVLGGTVVVYKHFNVPLVEMEWHLTVDPEGTLHLKHDVSTLESLFDQAMHVGALTSRVGCQYNVIYVYIRLYFEIGGTTSA